MIPFLEYTKQQVGTQSAILFSEVLLQSRHQPFQGIHSWHYRYREAQFPNSLGSNTANTRQTNISQVVWITSLCRQSAHTVDDRGRTGESDGIHLVGS